MKVTLCVDVNDPDEVAAVERWRQVWGERVALNAENQGCGCCVDIWDVEAPEEAIKELPQSVISSEVPAVKARHKRPGRLTTDAKGCIVAALIVAVGFGLVLLASVYVIPYQDPTPELRAAYARDIESAKTLVLTGLTVLCVGFLASGVVCFRWAKRRIALRMRSRARSSPRQEPGDT